MEHFFTLTGVIDAKLVADTIIWANDHFLSGNMKKLRFHISSIGGDVDSALRLYDFLKALPIEIEMIGFGQVDSAANIIFLAGTKRIAVKNCRFLLHQGTYQGHQGSMPLAMHEEAMNLFNELHRRHIEIITSETGKNKTEIEKLLKEGKILTTNQAKDLGIVHEIIEKFSPIVQTVASTAVTGA